MTEAPTPPGLGKMMADLPARILSTEIYHPARPGKDFEILSGHTIQWCPFLFQGARLVRFSDGTLRLHLPGHGGGSRVIVQDKPIRAALLNAAMSAVVSAGLPLATASLSEISEHEHP